MPLDACGFPDLPGSKTGLPVPAGIVCEPMGFVYEKSISKRLHLIDRIDGKRDLRTSAIMHIFRRDENPTALHTAVGPRQLGVAGQQAAVQYRQADHCADVDLSS
jgi:hypothetical protein